MDYNTERKKLIFPEYGRHIQRMVEQIMGIENREERTQAAHTIIALMGSTHPHLRDIPDFKHKLWDHLAIMTDFKLDIETPFPLPEIEKLGEKPKKIPYPSGSIKIKHYGRSLERIIEKAIEMEESEERDTLIILIANQIKKSYLLWNKDSVTDDVIIKDLAKLSDNKLKLKDDFRFVESRDVFARKKQNHRPQRKR